MVGRLLLSALLFWNAPSMAQTWGPIPSPITGYIQACSFVSADTGWVIGGGPYYYIVDSIFKTVNGGATWVMQQHPPAPAHDHRYFTGLDFHGSNVGIISCVNYLYGGVDPDSVSTVLWTNDGGANWTYKDLGDNNDEHLDAVLASDSIAYAISQYGQCKRTVDGGYSWSPANFTGIYSGVELFAVSEDTIYFAGLDNFALLGAFGRTVNGGSNWDVSVVSSDTMMNAIYFVNGSVGWVGGYGGEILRTLNGGLDWSLCNSGSTSLINGLAFVDAFHGWAVTSSGEVLKTADGGVNWALEYVASEPLNEIEMTSLVTGYAVGNHGLILKYALSSGVPEPSCTDGLQVTANASNSELLIKASRAMDGAAVRICDAQGRWVAGAANIKGMSVTIPIGSRSPGIYIVQWTDGAGAMSRKVFIH